MTKEALRQALAVLREEIDRQLRYEHSGTVTLPIKLLERWKQRAHELSEDELLWS